eukprot:1147662-Pelagomonas_calceolata.AAC.4
MEVPDEVQRSVSQWMFPSQQLGRTQLSRPDAIIVLPLDRDSTRSPEHINPSDRDILVIELRTALTPNLNKL